MSQLSPSLGIHSLCNPPPCMLTGLSDLLLMNGRWPRWWDITSMTKLQKAMTSCSSFLLLCWGSKLPGSNMLYGEASVRQPVRNWVLPTAMWVSQEVDPSNDCTKWEPQDQRTQGSHAYFPGHTEKEILEMFMVICYATINNKEKL